MDSTVLVVADVAVERLVALLQRFGLKLEFVEDNAPITGSFWGDSEAGLVGCSVYVRGDTPIHSLLHETCHAICMSGDRRAHLDCDAGGDDLEEAAVCYLQIVLADCIVGVGHDRLMLDMDEWGYSFRLGSTREWFERDAEDAKEFLLNHGLLTNDGKPAFVLRS